MAQHDYDIGNQTGSAFRADLNNALAAIVSVNSGAADPATMFAYQLYADTTNNLLKQRNAGNSGWVTIGTLGATNLGLAALASPTFTGVPLAPTASAGTNTTQIATTAFVVSSYLPLTGGTVTGNVTLNAQSDIRFADADSSNYVALQAPATVAANLTLTLPAADGSSGQALTTDGSGALAFATIGGVPTGAVFYFAANTAPTGFLKANGAAVSRTTYAALFAITGTTMALVMAPLHLTCLICVVNLYVVGMMPVVLMQAAHLVVRRRMGSGQVLSRELLEHTIQGSQLQENLAGPVELGN